MTQEPTVYKTGTGTGKTAVTVGGSQHSHTEGDRDALASALASSPTRPAPLPRRQMIETWSGIWLNADHYDIVPVVHTYTEEDNSDLDDEENAPPCYWNVYAVSRDSSAPEEKRTFAIYIGDDCEEDEADQSSRAVASLIALWMTDPERGRITQSDIKGAIIDALVNGGED